MIWNSALTGGHMTGGIWPGRTGMQSCMMQLYGREGYMPAEHRRTLLKRRRTPPN